MKKLIILCFSVSFISFAAPAEAFDFSKATKDTLLNSGSSKSSLGNPLMGDMGGWKSTKKVTPVVSQKKKKKKWYEKLIDKIF